MVFRLAAGAVAEVVVPLGLAKAGFLSGSTGVLGIVAAAEIRYRSTISYCLVLEHKVHLGTARHAQPIRCTIVGPVSSYIKEPTQEPANIDKLHNILPPIQLAYVL